MKELLSHTHVSTNDFIINLETVLTILTFYSYYNYLYTFTSGSKLLSNALNQTAYYFFVLIISLISLFNHLNANYFFLPLSSQQIIYPILFLILIKT